MRNGITPVMQMRKAGVNVAMGLDDKTINDDEDAVMELRMMHKVHRIATYDSPSRRSTPTRRSRSPPLNGARVCGFEARRARSRGHEGRRRAGRPGARGERALARSPVDIAEAFVQRAMGSDVDTVVIGGRVAMQGPGIHILDVRRCSRRYATFATRPATSAPDSVRTCWRHQAL
jgi:cytosine/adenosine deaminase-related metal-dependent hydrolase